MENFNSINELKNIVKSTFPGYLIDSAYEYGEIIVFNLIPKDFNISEYDEGPLNKSVKILKQTKEIQIFNPRELSSIQFEKGIKII